MRGLEIWRHSAMKLKIFPGRKVGIGGRSVDTGDDVLGSLVAGGFSRND